SPFGAAFSWPFSIFSGPPVGFSFALAAVGSLLSVFFVVSYILTSALQLLHKYRDRSINLADACLVYLADELQAGDILTLDADFGIYRWSRNKPFRNLVELS